MISYSHIRSAIDDHSRPAYSEVLTDERQEIAPPPTAFLHAHNYHRRHTAFGVHPRSPASTPQVNTPEVELALDA
ncbi:hypothetical protein [Streptantibioticus silvisoli]|uniref:hypothetical protein n=1 Tax=Streptantibioticus silvisoli TaxID=2705255 RepID=UPI003F6C8EF1